MVKAVIFDLDGTLVDSEPFFRDVRKKQLSGLGLDHIDSRSGVGISLRRFWKNVLDENGVKGDCSLLAKQTFESVYGLIEENSLAPNDGAAELLKTLKQHGVTTAVASCSDRDYVVKVLEFLKLRSYFDYILCGDEVENLKPAPDIYLKALKQCKVSACDAAAVEDSSVGISSAVAAGIYCIGYDSPKSQVAQDYSGCDVKVNSLNGVFKIIFS